jgi:hypothetical protein
MHRIVQLRDRDMDEMLADAKKELGDNKQLEGMLREHRQRGQWAGR